MATTPTMREVPAFQFSPLCHLARLDLPELLRQDVALVLARIEIDMRARATNGGGDFWLKMSKLVEDHADQWPRRIAEGYTKPTKLERSTGLVFAPRLRTDALDIATGRLVLVTENVAEHKVPKREKLFSALGVSEKGVSTFDHVGHVQDLEHRALLRAALAELENDPLPTKAGERRTEERRRRGFRQRLDDASREAVAAHLGCTVQVVDNDYSQMLTRLRERIGEQQRRRLGDHAREHLSGRRAYLGGRERALRTTLTGRNGIAVACDLKADDPLWHADGMLHAELSLPSPWPHSCFGYAVIRVAAGQPPLVSGLCQVIAQEGRSRLVAHLGTPPPAHVRRGPLPLPHESIDLFLAHGEPPAAATPA